MTAIVLRGDARRLPLPDACVDLIVTSPPYFGLRSYTDGGEHYDGQIGSEVTPAAYLDQLWACTAQWCRVLKPGGSMFINLGDKYQSTAPGTTNAPRDIVAAGGRASAGGAARATFRPDMGLPPKCLAGIPWRYAIGCTDRLGLILRAEIIWSKPNGLPESVTDRVRRAHEQVFHFTRQPRYYAAVDEIREPQETADRRGDRRSYAPGSASSMLNGEHQRMTGSFAGLPLNPLGKLPGSVWPIPSAPLVVPERLGVDHFAAFPPALVRPLVLGWSPPGVCTACGEGRRPVVDRQLRPDRNHAHMIFTDGRQKKADLHNDGGMKPSGHNSNGYPKGEMQATITGYACACPQPTAPTRPAVVLDPFAGTGTTMLVASAYGRIGVGVDRSMDYARLAQWRVRDPGERARARDMPKPPPVPDGMEPLFTM